MRDEKPSNNPLREAKLFFSKNIMLRDMCFTQNFGDNEENELLQAQMDVPQKFVVTFSPVKDRRSSKVEDIKEQLSFECECIENAPNEAAKKFRVLNFVEIKKVVTNMDLLAAPSSDNSTFSINVEYQVINIEGLDDFEGIKAVVNKLYDKALQLREYCEDPLEDAIGASFYEGSFYRPKNAQQALKCADMIVNFLGLTTDKIYHYAKLTTISEILRFAYEEISKFIELRLFVKATSLSVKEKLTDKDRAKSLFEYINQLMLSLTNFAREKGINLESIASMEWENSAFHRPDDYSQDDYDNRRFSEDDAFNEPNADYLKKDAQRTPFDVPEGFDEQEKKFPQEEEDKIIAQTFLQKYNFRTVKPEIFKLLKSAYHNNILENPEAVRVFLDALNNLNASRDQGYDYSINFEYAKVMSKVPWGVRSTLSTDMKSANEILESDHYGLKEVKERILEYLAVVCRSNELKAPVLCFSGPPGVGKTTLARSIAKATGRKFEKVALGGMHNESEIRGHRKTYISALPGRIIKAIINSGVKNPVILLDEVDKIGRLSSNGDPSAALLEVLDPDQNKNFNDNYLGIDFDLSEVMFIATSNDNSQIPKPLLDRMDVIGLSSYTEEEKLYIAKNHLIKKILNESMMKEDEISFTDEAILKIIRNYTAEAGVRTLERTLGRICRKILYQIETLQEPSKDHDKYLIDEAKVRELLGKEIFNHNDDNINQHQIGVVNGLAYTEAGGEVLNIEALCFEGRGKQIFTGQIGDVMKESISTAVSVVRAHSKMLKIKNQCWDNLDLHIHCPAGAIRKDGPSAGITMCTAIASALAKKKVNCHVAMTGEITLRGQVLAIGGLKEKLLAASRYGITKVIIPKVNLPDLEEVPKSALDKLEIIPVNKIEEVFEVAFDLT